MDLDLEFTSHILKNKEDLLFILGKSFDIKCIDFTKSGFSAPRAVCYCILNFYKSYNELITISQVESYVTNICSQQEQVVPILQYFKLVFDYEPTTNFNFLLDNIRKEYSLFILKNSLLDVTNSLDQEDVDTIVSKMQQGLNKVTSLENTEVVEGDMASSLDAFYDKYKKVQQGEMSVGLPTGFQSFDKATGGLKAGELDIVMAGSNEGKSVFLINVAHHLYLRGKNILYFSIELPKDQIIRRFLALAANINIDRFRDGILTADENTRFINTMSSFKQKQNMFYIVDNPTCNADSIAAKFEELNTKNKIDLIIIDYLGIMRPKKSTGQKWEELGNIALEVRHLARTFKVPVITAMQVKSEAVKNSKNPVYNMTDIANSFMVIHHADTVLALKLKDPIAVMQGLSVVEMTASTPKVRDGQKCQFDITAMFANMRMQEPNNNFGVGETQMMEDQSSATF